MKKTGRPSQPRAETSLWSDIPDVILEARQTVARGVNATLVWTNFEIGRRNVEHEQWQDILTFKDPMGSRCG